MASLLAFVANDRAERGLDHDRILDMAVETDEQRQARSVLSKTAETSENVGLLRACHLYGKPHRDIIHAIAFTPPAVGAEVRRVPKISSPIIARQRAEATPQIRSGTRVGGRNPCSTILIGWHNEPICTSDGGI